MTRYVKIMDKVYDLSDGSLRLNEPCDGVWSAEMLLCDIEELLNVGNKVIITNAPEPKPTKTKEVTAMKAIYYHDELVVTEENDDECPEAFEHVHLDYWACVEMYAEGERDKSKPMPSGFLHHSQDCCKAEKFNEAMWNGRIPYLEVKECLKPCPLCGTSISKIDEIPECNGKTIQLTIKCPECKLIYNRRCDKACYNFTKKKLIDNWNRRKSND